MKSNDMLDIRRNMVDGIMSTGEFYDEIPTSATGRIKFFLNLIWGTLVFSFIKVKNRRLISNFKPLADHLEKQVFPELKEKRRKSLRLQIDERDEEKNTVVAVSGELSFTFPGLRLFTAFLLKNKITCLELDTFLESNQLIDTLILYIYALPFIGTADSKQVDNHTWNRRQIASGILQKEGFHRFCANTSFIKERGVLRIEYTYCELITGRLAKAYANAFSRFSDHRAYYSLAPVAAIGAFGLISLPVILAMFQFQVWTFFWLPPILIPPLGALMTMYVLGAVQYHSEHHELLVNEYIRKEKVLARFPEINSNPVYKISATGSIIYINPAVQQLMEEELLLGHSLDKLLPENYAELANKSLREKKSIDVEYKEGNKVFRYLISPFEEDETALFAGSDITYLRTIEKELQDINSNLESLVEKRTEELRATEDATILCLGGLSEIRDPETGEHIQRTRSYTRAMAVALKSHPRFKHFLDDRTIEYIFKSAPLHDIGKVGIPDSILLKPGALSKEEFSIMQQHPQFGADALNAAIERLGFDSYLNIASDIAIAHHEKWDGTGYPFGLRGNTNNLPARIVAVADVYDALTSKRVYKDAMSHDEAIAIIKKESGSHFDPMVVESFLSIKEKILEVATRLLH